MIGFSFTVGTFDNLKNKADEEIDFLATKTGLKRWHVVAAVICKYLIKYLRILNRFWDKATANYTQLAEGERDGGNGWKIWNLSIFWF